MLRTAVLLAAIPFANALSLANFQDITSTFIPLTCQFVYDQQIPDCEISDFGDDGCSTECQQTLTSLANSVAYACSNVNANSHTLLGIIKNGKILKALCPTVQKFTSSAVQTTVAQTTARPAVVTIPTASPGVVLETTSPPAPVKTTVSPALTVSTAVQKSTAQASSSAVSSPVRAPSSAAVSSTVRTSILTDVTSTVESTQTSAAATTSQTTVQPPSSTTTSSEAAASTTSPSTSPSSATSSLATNTKPASGAATQKATAQLEGGGGSPFDINSNSGFRLGPGPMLAFFMATCAGLFLGQ